MDMVGNRAETGQTEVGGFLRARRPRERRSQRACGRTVAEAAILGRITPRKSASSRSCAPRKTAEDKNRRTDSFGPAIPSRQRGRMADWVFQPSKRKRTQLDQPRLFKLGSDTAPCI